MNHVEIIATLLILIISALIIGGVPNDLFGSIEYNDDMAQVKNLLSDLNSRVQHLEKKNDHLSWQFQALEKRNQQLEKRNNEMSTKISNFGDEKKDINDELQYLKELSKLNVVRTCEEMHQYGVNKSDHYLIDPDGPLTGKEPIRVFCNFTEDLVTTMVSHDSEQKIEVSHCADPGCYSRKINYDAPLEQIEALIDLSELCTQQIRYDCFLSALQEGGINFGFWQDKSGESQYYWTGSHYGQHTCSCHFSEEGCFEEDILNNVCNCDANKPAELFDDGIIANSSALPIIGLNFGGLALDAQSAYHTLGKLNCAGKKTVDSKATSCSSLKLDGNFQNGYYNIKNNGQHSKLVFCDMDHPGYTEVPEEFIESSENHFDELDEYINESEISMVVFSTYRKSTVWYKSGEYINGFDGFLSNYGNTFDLASGIFTTPKPGMYEFSFAFRHTNIHGPARMQVWKNDVNELEFFSYSETNDDTLSATWVMTLQKSDTVRLKADGGDENGNTFRCTGGAHCVFNGKYIRSI